MSIPKPKSYLLRINYYGEKFHGFQSQPCGNTVQDHLEKALSTFLRDSIRVTGASRTDSGVHAKDQWCVFRTTTSFETFRLVKAMKALLPFEIGIKSLEPVDDDFHPIRASKCKLYRYRVWTSVYFDVFEAKRSWVLGRKLDLEKVEHEAKSFIGSHDFVSFCASDSSVKTTVRNILDVKIQAKETYIDILVLGEGFLKQMVRAMVGTLVEHGLNKNLPSVKQIILAKDRTKAGATAPANGLTLEKIYPNLLTSIEAS